MSRLVALVFCVFFTSIPLCAAAQETHVEKVEAVYEALLLPEVLEIMREEGLSYGDAIADDMFPGAGGEQWPALVSSIYSVDVMRQEVLAAMIEELEGEDLDAMLSFFQSEPGRSIVNLEVSARRAMLDDVVEQASTDSAAIAMADETPRFQLVREFVEVNDLIETNVVSALNSNYAFYMGLIDGGAMPQGITEESALKDVWMQEPEIRVNTTQWLYSFLLLAYQPLSDEDLQGYISFSRSEAGKALNAAMFVAFDGMFDDISRGLGLASSRLLITQEL